VLLARPATFSARRGDRPAVAQTRTAADLAASWFVRSPPYGWAHAMDARSSTSRGTGLGPPLRLLVEITEITLRTPMEASA
jgi:hypothetical protein